MTFGVTPEGFIGKRLADCKAELEDDFRGIFGESIDLAPNRPFGQLVGIFAERESLIWEAFEAVYQSGYPRWASGASLEGVISLNGLIKQKGTYSEVGIKVFGDFGTVIPFESIISVLGNSDAKFSTDAQMTIGAGINDKQTIDFNGTPVSGSFTLLYDGASTAAIAFNANAAAVKAALELLDEIDEVTVTGTVATDFLIEFTGDSGEMLHPLMTIGANTLLNVTPVAVVPTIAHTVSGSLPFATGTATAVETGETIALAGTLTVIETSVTGWDTVTNLLDAELGQEIESDAEVKLRREQQLANGGSATLEAIRSRLLAVNEISAATVYHNVQDTTVDGLTPHSVKALVEGGTDEVVAATLFGVVGAGIRTYGDETVVVTDSQGFNHDIKFSRPTEILIWLEADITVNDEFPPTGDDLLLAAILEYGSALAPGDDVIVYPKLIRIFDDVEFPGIIDIVIRIGTSASPTLDDSIEIDNDEKAKWDSSRITIDVTVDSDD